jgi:hypothetical protein
MWTHFGPKPQPSPRRSGQNVLVKGGGGRSECGWPPLRYVPFSFHASRMRIGPDDLRDKALLALEEALQDLRYLKARRSIAVGFALAYLWACRLGDRRPFDDFWRALGETSPWRLDVADRALLTIYRTLGVERDEELSWRMWDRAHKRHSPLESSANAAEKSAVSD